MNNPALLDLQARYRERRLLPFVGAGASMSVSWTSGVDVRRGPSWSELVDQAARMLGFDDPDLLRARGEDLQILEYYRMKNHGELAPLRNWLVDQVRAPDDALQTSPLHAELVAMDHCEVFYTTNFDDFIERSFKLHGRACKKVAIEAHLAESMRDIADGAPRCEVIKFHGDLENPSSMVMSEADYRARLSLRTAMDDRLKADLLGRTVLFIGYSFRDWNVSYLFHLVNEQFGEQLPLSTSGRRAYITVADPSDFEFELFRARNIEVLPVTGDSFTHDVVALLRAIREGPA